MEREELLKNLGARIREQRNTLKISQEELAYRSDFDRTYISLVERGKRNISFTNLFKLTKALEVTISELTKEI